MRGHCCYIEPVTNPHAQSSSSRLPAMSTAVWRRGWCVDTSRWAQCIVKRHIALLLSHGPRATKCAWLSPHPASPLPTSAGRFAARAQRAGLQGYAPASAAAQDGPGGGRLWHARQRHAHRARGLPLLWAPRSGVPLRKPPGQVPPPREPVTLLRTEPSSPEAARNCLFDQRHWPVPEAPAVDSCGAPSHPHTIILDCPVGPSCMYCLQPTLIIILLTPLTSLLE